MTAPESLHTLGPATDRRPYERTMPPELRQAAEEWPLRRGTRPPEHLIEALECMNCGAFIIALTDRHGSPYQEVPQSSVTAATLAHMIRNHGFRPNGAIIHEGEDVSRETS